MGTLPAECVDLVVTSPPYDNLRVYGKQNNYVFENVALALKRVLKPGGVIAWIIFDQIRADKPGAMSLTSFRNALFFDDIGLQVHDVMFWDRGSHSTPNPNRYNQTVQYMIIISKGRPKTFNPIMKPQMYGGHERHYRSGWIKEQDKCMTTRRTGHRKHRTKLTNVWRVPVGRHHNTKDKYASEHPAIFPETIAHRHILTWSNPGELVFDPMCGSGTTCKMAKLSQRKYLGCEIHEPYYQIALRRINTSHGGMLDSFFDKS